ncbi:MAG TPA: hypothetical protein DHE23_21635 [Agrobacterium sp.]|nr:hypothetical protein [Agrobacterium sp.]
MRQSTEAGAYRLGACTAADAFRQSDLDKIGSSAPHHIEPGRSRFKLAIPFLRGNDFRVRRYIGLYMERYNARYIHDSTSLLRAIGQEFMRKPRGLQLIGKE